MATKRLPKKETNTPSSGNRQGSPSHWHQTGFLKKGSAKPAYAPLLLVLAGDIELNPGPECHKCKKTNWRRPSTLQVQALQKHHAQATKMQWSLAVQQVTRMDMPRTWRTPGGPGPNVPIEKRGQMLSLQRTPESRHAGPSMHCQKLQTNLPQETRLQHNQQIQ